MNIGNITTGEFTSQNYLQNKHIYHGRSFGQTFQPWSVNHMIYRLHSQSSDTRLISDSWNYFITWQLVRIKNSELLYKPQITRLYCYKFAHYIICMLFKN